MIKIIKRFFNRNGSDPIITMCVLFLVFFGIVMIGSACIGQTATYGEDFAVSTMKSQTLYIIIGLAGMFILTRIYKSSWVNIYTCSIISMIGLISMCACRLFDSHKGSYAWIEITSSMTIQPAEFMKPVLIVVLAYMFSDVISRMPISRNLSFEQRQEQYYRKALICVGIPVLLIGITAIVGLLVQKDLGTTVIMCIICGIMFLCTNNRFYMPYKKLAVIVVVLAIIVLRLVLKPYQLARITILGNPLSDPYDTGYQLVNSLIAFSGGLLGKGFGKSTLKYGFIPESHNDFIFAIIFEELGIVGMLCVFLPYCYIIFKLFSYSTKIKDERDRLILIGIATYLFAHLFINIGGVSGFIPMTGVPLLMISAGGSSALACLFSIGVAQSIICKYHRNCSKEQL